jgi:DNA-binding transcriptional ArsR family regulator
MSVLALDWALYRAPAHCPNETALLMHLANGSEPVSGHAVAVISDLAEKTGLDQRTVERRLNALTERGVIEPQPWAAPDEAALPRYRRRVIYKLRLDLDQNRGRGKALSREAALAARKAARR